MQVLPVHERLHFYSVCCGKIICGGCEHQHQTKNKEWAAKRGQKTVPRQTCAFCRTTAPGCAEEALARLSKRVELKDPNALRCMAMENGNGGLGLPVDQAKCIELLRESAGLGFPSAQYHLGSFYRFGEMGLEQNEEEALKYLEEAAEGGHLCSRYPRVHIIIGLCTLGGIMLGAQRKKMAIMLLQCVTFDCRHQGGTGGPWKL